jgi:hypothetical protein
MNEVCAANEVSANEARATNEARGCASTEHVDAEVRVDQSGIDLVR